MILVGQPLGAPTHNRLPESLGIERDLVAASETAFLAGLGEELWKKFLPKYLESLGAGVAVVRLFGASVHSLTLFTNSPAVLAGRSLGSPPGVPDVPVRRPGGD